jgi:Tol biopolymer transport system component
VSINGAAKFDVWLYDFARQVLTRLTTDILGHRFPVWAPDGKRVAFTSLNIRTRQVSWMAIDNPGTVEPIFTPEDRAASGSISPDGVVLLYTLENPKSRADIWAVELSGTHGPRPFLQTSFAEAAPTISPDGLWVAYVSNEWGKNEIYVRPFSGTGQRWQASADGGEGPVWARSGRELFYINGDKMMAVPVLTSGPSTQSVVMGPPKLLFNGHYRHNNAPFPNFDVSVDDQRFLMIREQTANRINIVLNMFDEFQQ